MEGGIKWKMVERCKYSRLIYYRILSLLWEMHFPGSKEWKNQKFLFAPTMGPAGDFILSPGFLNIPQSHAGLLLFDKFQTLRTYEILATYTDNS